jgi:hypothetical protein
MFSSWVAIKDVVRIRLQCLFRTRSGPNRYFKEYSGLRSIALRRLISQNSKTNFVKFLTHFSKTALFPLSKNNLLTAHGTYDPQVGADQLCLGALPKWKKIYKYCDTSLSLEFMCMPRPRALHPSDHPRGPTTWAPHAPSCASCFHSYGWKIIQVLIRSLPLTIAFFSQHPTPKQLLY